MERNDQPKRKVGRPKNPERDSLQKSRRFYPLEKTPLTVTLMMEAHAAFQQKHGKDGTDTEVLRDALREYGKSG